MQTWRPAEVILVDDASGDTTLDRLLELRDKYPADWIQVVALTENSGPGVARNTGWNKSSQPYIAFLDADDAWHPEKVKFQLGWMLAHPDAAVTCHSVQVVKVIDNHFQSMDLSKFQFKRLSCILQLLSNHFSPPATIVRQNIPHRFAVDKRHCEDYLLFTEICLDGYLCYFANVPLTNLFKERYGVSGLTGNLWLMELGELDFYFRLVKSRRLPWVSLLFFFPFSLMKYLRRVIKNILR